MGQYCCDYNFHSWYNIKDVEGYLRNRQKYKMFSLKQNLKQKPKSIGHYILLVFLLMYGCAEKQQPCGCDLLQEKEKYFIKSGKLLETNTNKSALNTGKEVSIDVSVETSPMSIKNKMDKITGGVSVSIPLHGYPKYEYVYNVEISDDAHERNKTLYFLAYCSFYPLYHEKQDNCKPKEGWENKVESLIDMYLHTEIREAKDSNNTTSTNKVITSISGKVINAKKVGIVDILYKNRMIGKSTEGGSFSVKIDGGVGKSVNLTFMSLRCGNQIESVFINKNSIDNIPVLFNCK